ncbi:hypothetical protein AN2478.2 [Paecilomyces variotii No. 5]|uniref:Xylose isomerase-like TIM barrel domain-containing protein n=1 Tax=Byssochlamys spectabilis (strain No. 5 / NBRC 109023) TaxID=1356009 RepID=V5G2S1_BYSSN|nr:hypothetical protein AN2478.2 [Paecilomyces variotii No. 5]
MTTLSNNVAISTSSLGLHPSHTLDRKIRLAAQHGFQGIEIVYNDLKTYSQIHSIPILTAAEHIRKLCAEHNLTILSLCPFENFEGSRSPLSDRLALAAHWLDLARILRTAHLQVPANYLPDAIGDEAVIVSELRQLADLASSSSPAVTIAYEPMSWSTHVSTWQAALDLTGKINRPNLGICMDSFHLVSKVWGCATSASGKYPNADRDLEESLREFVKQFPLEKLLYVQLSDGEKFEPPFSKSHPWYIDGEAAEFTWSKHARPFPLEKELGGYMPLVEVVRGLVIEKGFDGWVSLESFDRRMREERFKPDIAARRAEESWRKLKKDLAQDKALL